MLRITVQRQAGSIVLQLEGKLIGPWVMELRRVWTHGKAMPPAPALTIDLTEVSRIDSDGTHLLQEIHSAGGRLVGSGLLARTFIEQAERSSQ
jgi:ABC-type transporter Mla MlaB component